MRAESPAASPAVARSGGPSSPSLLARASSPGGLRELPAASMPALAREIREFLVEAVARTGGHLGSNLGVVELTIALHRVFESPSDTLVFDTGHQAYVHKLLTGRRDDFDGLRQAGGMSGYPARAESWHDVVENSHASTALSYADGLAKAYRLQGEHGRAVVAVIGDGALTGGMAYEALNNIGAGDRPVVVVLNDNGRSYSPTVGGLAHHLAALRSGPAADNIFTSLGLAYVGPVDGHDVAAVEAALLRARALQRPVVVHLVTVKGSGYGPAESDDIERFHAVGAFDPESGRRRGAAALSWTDVFGEEIAALGAERPELVCVTAAMLHSTGLNRFAARFPDRIFDVGIAEQHAVTSAAGLAMGGLHPVVAIYATFFNRAFDQVLTDVALHGLPVTFVLDRAGITGPDGASHHGVWDLSALSPVPGLRIGVPRDAASLRELLREAVGHPGPTVLRFPKAKAGVDLPAVLRRGGVDVLNGGGTGDLLLVGLGPLAGECLQAADRLALEGIAVTVADPRWALPVPGDLVALARAHELVVSVEDGGRTGGFGAALAQACHDAGVVAPVRNLGLPRAFVPHGGRAELLERVGLDAQGILDAVRAAMAERPVAVDLPDSARLGVG